jgi:hypothetical protein
MLWVFKESFFGLFSIAILGGGGIARGSIVSFSFFLIFLFFA